MERPKLTAGPTDVIVKEHEKVHLECHFTASLIPHLALCGWLKDGKNAYNGKKSQTVISGSENQLICGFTINSASAADGGNYICYLYYNESYSEQFHFKNVTSRNASAVVQVEKGIIL